MEARDSLIGALIGLSRATYGDTKPDRETWRLLEEGLNALSGALAEEALRGLADRVREEKKRLVPRCSECASPCGRNADYDLNDMQTDPAETRELKTAILDAVKRLAKKTAGMPESGGEEAGRFFAKALFALGEDWDSELLRPILTETEARM
jgi:hydroxylamine reductase